MNPVCNLAQVPAAQRAGGGSVMRRPARMTLGILVISCATSAGAAVVGEFLQHRDKPDPATLIGRGKVQEIAGAAAMSGVTPATSPPSECRIRSSSAALGRARVCSS